MVLLALIGIVALAAYTDNRERLVTESFHAVVLMIVLFAFGQLVSQWTDRPLLAFLAAPAYAFVSLSPIFYLIEAFDAPFAVIVLTVPVLLFATWRLTRYWLDGQIKSQFTARVLAYTALAVLMPFLWIALTGLMSHGYNNSLTLLVGITP